MKKEKREKKNTASQQEKKVKERTPKIKTKAKKEKKAKAEANAEARTEGKTKTKAKKSARKRVKNEEKVKFSIRMEILAITMIPLIVLTMILSAFCYNAIQTSMESEVLTGLKDLCYSLSATYSTLDSGAYALARRLAIANTTMAATIRNIMATRRIFSVFA